jgi:hypothetical protein
VAAPDYEWMMRLGQLVSRAVDTPRRAVAAITLPCRAYAAALVAVGCVLSHDPLGFNRDAPEDEELAAHFANLSALRPGTTVAVASGRIKRVGRFIGVDYSRREPHLIIEQRAGDKKQGFTQYIPLRDAHNVAVRGLPQVP